MSMLNDLLKLVQEHPDLPVIPMVDGEICICADWARYMAEIGSCYLDEYVLMGERVYFDRCDFSEDLYDAFADELCEHFDYNPSENSSQNLEKEKRLDAFLDTIAEKVFRPAIIVNINRCEEPPIDVGEIMRQALKEAQNG